MSEALPFGLSHVDEGLAERLRTGLDDVETALRANPKAKVIACAWDGGALGAKAAMMAARRLLDAFDDNRS